MNNYIISFTKKFDYFFDKKEILNIIYLHDEDDNERLDHVLFFEKDNGDVIGLYIRGMNPLISVNRVYDLDDFNLFSSYEGLIECKENIKLKIEYIGLFFSTQYNELLGFYLENNDASSSIFILFLQDEIYMEKDCSKYEASRILENRFSTEGFITYKKTCETDWRQFKVER
ncbi:hypothetical protein ACNA06_04940 [Lysinibacillus sp. RSDA_15]|uniref:hypothetical protein n=1 Tax=Lysinibacillus TaxID=400634 RepID=UPI0004DF941E|nr:hypothetical protein [Lysinibacillus sphaericus]MBG9756795.1 hypothetical protein [Lysinibacillus sphaericus]QPA57460.1 hypothetical protein INQ55_14850 [Lysinibacillus sphaericus]QTB12181.1 hypothetical protein J2B92_14910 [Lysinibacillus sphaericus]QTB21104.1 hypothetical protein J1907_15130 [Lysinibacillus sphaericus]